MIGGARFRHGATFSAETDKVNGSLRMNPLAPLVNPLQIYRSLVPQSDFRPYLLFP